MRVPFNWLKQFTPLSRLAAEDVAERLTMRGLEVEGLEPSPHLSRGLRRGGRRHREASFGRQAFSLPGQTREQRSSLSCAEHRMLPRGRRCRLLSPVPVWRAILSSRSESFAGSNLPACCAPRRSWASPTTTAGSLSFPRTLQPGEPLDRLLEIERLRTGRQCPAEPRRLPVDPWHSAGSSSGLRPRRHPPDLHPRRRRRYRRAHRPCRARQGGLSAVRPQDHQGRRHRPLPLLDEKQDP